MSTILPEEISGGSNIEGNSIYGRISLSIKAAEDSHVAIQRGGTYQPLVLGQQHGNAGIYFTDCQRNEHWCCCVNLSCILSRALCQVKVAMKCRGPPDWLALHSCLSAATALCKAKRGREVLRCATSVHLLLYIAR